MRLQTSYLVSWCFEPRQPQRIASALRLQTEPLQNSMFLKINIPRCPGLTPFASKVLKVASKLKESFFHNPYCQKLACLQQLKAKAQPIKTQKTISLQNFCSLLNSKTKPKTVWKAIRKIKGNSTSSLSSGHLTWGPNLLPFKGVHSTPS